MDLSLKEKQEGSVTTTVMVMRWILVARRYWSSSCSCILCFSETNQHQNSEVTNEVTNNYLILDDTNSDWELMRLEQRANRGSIRFHSRALELVLNRRHLDHIRFKVMIILLEYKQTMITVDNLRGKAQWVLHTLEHKFYIFIISSVKDAVFLDPCWNSSLFLIHLVVRSSFSTLNHCWEGK